MQGVNINMNTWGTLVTQGVVQPMLVANIDRGTEKNPTMLKAGILVTGTYQQTREGDKGEIRSSATHLPDEPLERRLSNTRQVVANPEKD